MGILYVQQRGVVIGGERTREQAWYYIGGWLSIAVVGATWWAVRSKDLREECENLCSNGSEGPVEWLSRNSGLVKSGPWIVSL